MEKLIEEKVVEGIKHLYGEIVNGQAPQKTRPDFEGDLTVVVFPFLKASKKSPEQTGEELGVYLKENIDAVNDFNVVKGFLNSFHKVLPNSVSLEGFLVLPVRQRLRCPSARLRLSAAS